MREIKFRVWDLSVSKYRTFLTLSANTGAICSSNPEHYVLEQFTGLHDKNGRGIYEGDIVRSSYRNFTVIIKYGEAKYLGVGVTLAGVIAQHLGGHKKEEPFMIYSGENDWEVIGNIHENPELINGLTL